MAILSLYFFFFLGGITFGVYFSSRNAAIPISSASSEDRSSRADIAASFQVAICIFMLYSFSKRPRITYSSTPHVFSFYFCNCNCFDAASCCTTSTGKMSASN